MIIHIVVSLFYLFKVIYATFRRIAKRKAIGSTRSDIRVPREQLNKFVRSITEYYPVICYYVTLPLVEIVANDDGEVVLLASKLSDSINHKGFLTRTLQHVSRCAYRPILSLAIIAHAQWRRPRARETAEMNSLFIRICFACWIRRSTFSACRKI